MTKPTPKGFNKLEPCPECGRWKTSRHGGGLICTNIRRCSLAISIEDDLAEIDGLRITPTQVEK
jgi:hypothetical protein